MSFDKQSILVTGSYYVVDGCYTARNVTPCAAK